MIEITNVAKKFGGFTALDNINLKLDQGKVHGIIGENGAGKTTLLQMIAGIYKTEIGSIKVLGEDVYENVDVKSQIGYVADRNRYFKNYKISQMVDFYEGIYKDFSREEFARLNEIFNLDESKEISQLSKGMEMRLSLMLNLSSNPKLLVLDEPSSGLDALAKKNLWEILINKLEQDNVTIIISSHHIKDLEKICDSVTILKKGRIKYQADVDQLKEKVKKFQVVFQSDVMERLKTKDYILNLDRIASVYYIVVEGDEHFIIEDLKNMGASLVENVGISLEEIFIYSQNERRKELE